jgi:OOP family OmpA-OmpF porin
MTKTKNMNLPLAVLAAGLAFVISACSDRSSDAPLSEEQRGTGDAAIADPPETVSILRPEIAPPEQPEAPREPLAVTVYFPKGGDDLDAAALVALQQVLSSPQIKSALPITLRGHSDAGGNDAANMRASQARAEAVRDWLMDNGVDGRRISIIAFGEQNPAEPNALPDGTPNEAGRAANRRVEIEIPVLTLTLSTTDKAGSVQTGD